MTRSSSPQRRDGLERLRSQNPVPPHLAGGGPDEAGRAALADILALPVTAAPGGPPAPTVRRRSPRPRLTAFVAAGATLLALLAGVGWTTHPIHRHVETSWANAYPTVPEMVRAGDAVVVGRVTGVQGTSVDRDTEIRYTDFEVTVDTWIAGAKAPSPVVVHQMGSASGFVTEDVADDPLLRVGERDVLVLSAYAPGRYYVTGGPTGRFPVDGDRVSSLPAGLVQMPADRSLAAFEEQLAATARAAGKATANS